MPNDKVREKLGNLGFSNGLVDADKVFVEFVSSAENAEAWFELGETNYPGFILVGVFDVNSLARHNWVINDGERVFSRSSEVDLEREQNDEPGFVIIWAKH